MKYKINRNQPPLTDEELASARSFHKILKGYHSMKVPFYKSGRFLTTGSALIVAAAIALIVLFDDKTETPQHSFISPPLAQAVIPSDTFIVDADSITNIDYKSGSKLHIPAGAFCDQKGNPIKGKVTLSYREFHDQRDIFLSGIPMTYDSAGSTYVFESAGMMDISASQNGSPLTVNAGKPIKVDMVSNTKEDRYNTYYLDTVSKKWVNLDQANLDKKQFEKNISDTAVGPGLLEKDPILTKSEQQVKQAIAEVKTVEREKPMPVAKADKSKTKFHIVVDAGEFPEIAMYKGVRFQVKDEKSFDPGSAKTEWEDVKLKKLTGIDYEVTFTKGAQLFKVIATPVVDDKDMPAAQKIYDRKFAEYQTKLQEQKAAAEKAKLEMERIMADQRLKDSMMESKMNKRELIYRTLYVNSFGFYNCDCPRINSTDANVVAVLTDENGNSLKLSELCLVEKSVVMICSYHSAYNECRDFKFNSKQDNALWGVTTDNKLAVIDSRSFRTQQAISGRVNFRFRIIDKEIHTSKEAMKYLDI